MGNRMKDRILSTTVALIVWQGTEILPSIPLRETLERGDEEHRRWLNVTDDEQFPCLAKCLTSPSPTVTRAGRKSPSATLRNSGKHMKG